ncbi:hypothetical protein ACOMHN_042893 [Nucella lapillus]
MDDLRLWFQRWLMRPVRALKACPQVGHMWMGTAVEVEVAQTLYAAHFLTASAAGAGMLDAQDVSMDPGSVHIEIFQYSLAPRGCYIGLLLVLEELPTRANELSLPKHVSSNNLEAT